MLPAVTSKDGAEPDLATLADLERRRLGVLGVAEARRSGTASRRGAAGLVPLSIKHSMRRNSLITQGDPLQLCHFVGILEISEPRVSQLAVWHGLGPAAQPGSAATLTAFLGRSHGSACSEWGASASHA